MWEPTKSLFCNVNSGGGKVMLNYFLSHQEQSHACCLCFVKAAYIVKHLLLLQMPLHLQMPLSAEAYLTHQAGLQFEKPVNHPVNS